MLNDANFFNGESSGETISMDELEKLARNPSISQIEQVANWLRTNHVSSEQLANDGAKRVFANCLWLVEEYKKSLDNYQHLSRTAVTASSSEIFTEQMNLLHLMGKHRDELIEDLELIKELLDDIGVVFDSELNQSVAEVPKLEVTDSSISTNMEPVVDSWSSDVAGIVPEHQNQPTETMAAGESAIAAQAVSGVEESKPVESVGEVHLSDGSLPSTVNTPVVESEARAEEMPTQNIVTNQPAEIEEVSPTENKNADLSTLNLDQPVGNQLHQIAETMGGNIGENYYQLLKQVFANDDYRNKLKLRAQKVVDNSSGNETFEQINSARDVLRSIDQIEVNPDAPLEVYAIASYFLG